MPVTLRPYQPDDAAAMTDLWLQCQLTRPWNDPTRDLMRKLQVQPELFLVGVDGARLVGSVMAGFDGHRGWLNYLAVHPDVQKQGIGRLLVQAAEEKLLALGCPKVNLQIRCSNEAAQAFYRKLGYAEDAALSFGKRLEFDSEASAAQGGTGTGGCEVRTVGKLGDLGGLLHLHSRLLVTELGADPTLEAELALELGRFLQASQPRERLWLAEKEGQVRGSLGLVQVAEAQAALKWWGLHLDERGKGLGRQLLEAALQFAQQSGFQTVQAELPPAATTAARLLQHQGFKEVPVTSPGSSATGWMIQWE